MCDVLAPFGKYLALDHIGRCLVEINLFTNGASSILKRSRERKGGNPLSYLSANKIKRDTLSGLVAIHPH